MRREGETGAENRLDGAGGDTNGYILPKRECNWLTSLGEPVVAVHVNF